MGMDIYGRNAKTPEGEYFRANVWSWRPLHVLCETVLKQKFPSWGYNDGDGFETQKQCDKLANELEKYLKAFPNESISMESDIRVDENNRFLRRGSTAGKSAYETSKEHVKKFIVFLRNCGGFKIL
jgi:hypothetical protein